MLFKKNIFKYIPVGFLFIICMALGVRLFLIVKYPGNLRPDETFQYFEPAHHMAFGPWVKTWEWRVGIRSWLMPTFIAGLFRLAVVLHVSNMVLFVRGVFSVLSLGLVGLFYWAGKQQAHIYGGVVFGLVAALWPDMVNAGVRPLGECFGGNLLVCGTLLAFIGLNKLGHDRVNERTCLLAGGAFLLGCAAAVRFQFAPAVIAAILYILFRSSFRDKVAVCVFCCLPVLALGLDDKIFLGSYYQSVFKNYYINIHMGIANKFGDKSFTYFIKKYVLKWGVISLPLLFLYVRGERYCRFPCLIGLVIIGYHSLIGHKEMSFIYPAIPLLLFGACYGLIDVWAEYKIGAVWGGLCLGTSLWLFMLSSYLPYWKVNSEIAQLQLEAVHQKDMCGLAFFAPDQEWELWPNTLGYSVVPLGKAFYLAETFDSLISISERYNYMIGYKGFDRSHDNFQLIDCGDETHICLYKREVMCRGDKDESQFSRTVEATGH